MGNTGAKLISLDGEESVKTLLYQGNIVEVSMENGTGYILKKDSKIKSEDFPSKADYYFTYTYTYDISIFDDFNDMQRKIKAVKDALAEDETITTVAYTNHLTNEVEILNVADYEDLTQHSIIKITHTNPSASFIESALPYVSILIMIFVGYFLFKAFSGKGGGINNFTKSRAKNIEKSKIKFEDIAGSEEEKEETAEIVEFLKCPTKFKALGARIPKGVLLVGPPGTGKTLLAKAVAGESNVPFFSISGSDFVELYVGVGASRVRDLFDTAKKNAPCIIFIDEIDAVGRQRGAGLGGGNDEREQTLNQLLVEMDGFEFNDGIIVMAATNRADVLDPALMRPGRFDRQIYVNVPDVRGREGIIKIHAKNKPIDKDVDFQAIARLTSGFTGADIENFLNEAAILAARKNKLTITMEDITEGINKVLMGPQKKSRLVTEKDKKLTAYHESGHAILAKLLDCGDKVHEVSIIPRGMAGGYTSTRPGDDDEHYTLEKLNNRICMIMGGRIAEEIVFKDITAGASSDIQKATEIARKMVTEWGMSDKLGFFNLGKSSEVFIGRDYQTQNSYSEQTASIIDSEIKKILDTNYEKAKSILSENISILDNMANLLLLKETIYEAEVDSILKGDDYKTVAKRLDAREKRRRAQEEKKQREQKLIQEKKLQELKEQAAIALKNAGVISESELESIKEESKRIQAEADVELQKVNKTKKTEKTTDNAETKEKSVEKEVIKEESKDKTIDEKNAETKNNQEDKK